MSSSPKRKNDEPSPGNNSTLKRPKTTSTTSQETPQSPPPKPPPDSHINHAAALAYWRSTPATVSGVLGGYPEVSRTDLQGSHNFLYKLRRASKTFPLGHPKKLRRVVDCGAGIGRVTEGFLSKIADVVDIVEPVKEFTQGIETEGEVYNVGLEEWFPEREGRGPYDLVWNQWCVGQLTDVQLVEYLERLPGCLSSGGWIVVKENLSNEEFGEDVFDEVDSSVTRTDGTFRRLFETAGLRVVASEVQRGMPSGLYPVRAYALQPR